MPDFTRSRRSAHHFAVHLCQVLLSECENDGDATTGRKAELRRWLCRFVETSAVAVDHVNRLNLEAERFDYGDGKRGNGYRSIVAIFDAALLQVVRCLCENWQGYAWCRFFSAGRLRDGLLAHVAVFCSIADAIVLLMSVYDSSTGRCLFPAYRMTDEMQALVSLFEGIDQSVHYGSVVGFQFCPSVRLAFSVITSAFAAYGALHERDQAFPVRLALIVRYGLNSKIRSQYVAHLYRNADISLFRSFWTLLETFPLKLLPKLIGPKLAVNRMIAIPADEKFDLALSNGLVLRVASPVVYTGSRPLLVRFLSSTCPKQLKRTGGAASRNLILHCHGGGFIATSTETHEMYLKIFAENLRCPIVSVEYSLAPENPYPRAAEEALFAYAWCLRNKEQLGWSGELICLVGESAGGLLLTSLCLKLIELKILRRPDALVTIYSPMMMHILPSPSRMLSLFDPIIPLGITYHCMHAYTSGLRSSGAADRVGVSNYEILKRNDSSEEIVEEASRLVSKQTADDELVFQQHFKPALSEDLLNFLSLYDIGEEFCQGRVGDAVKSERSQRLSVTVERSVGNMILFFTELALDAVSLLGDTIELVVRSIGRCASSVKSVLCIDGNKDCQSVVTSSQSSKSFASIRSSSANVTALDDPFISPLLASDEVLRLLPPVSVIACHMDPLLDDSVTFAKRLRSLGCPHTLDLLEAVPHGFMNLIPGSEECKQATLLCAQRISSHLL